MAFFLPGDGFGACDSFPWRSAEQGIEIGGQKLDKPGIAQFARAAEQGGRSVDFVHIIDMAETETVDSTPRALQTPALPAVSAQSAAADLRSALE